MNCHNCGGACHNEDYKQFPGYQYDFVGGNCDAPAADTANADAELVAKITKQAVSYTHLLPRKKRQDVRQRPQQLQQHRKQLRTEIIPQKMFSMMKMEML